MQKYLPKMQLIIPDSKTLEYKEALIFGLLGV
jgi:anhydro-N-acetylmuramic acid kinase